MSFLKISILLVLILSVTIVQAAIPVKVVLLAGQSNMIGAGDASQLPVALQSPQPDVLLFDGTPTAPGVLQALAPRAGNFGPEITFGRKIADDHPTQRYALIKYAAGGSSLGGDWRATSPIGGCYTAFKTTVTNGMQALVQAGYAPQISGMLWLQGESDATSSPFAASYQQNLTDLIADARATYGAGLPFVIGGIGFGGDFRSAVVSAQQSIAGTIPNVRYFDNDDLNPAHDLHFNASALQIIGQRYATQLESIPEPGGISLLVAGALLIEGNRRRRNS